MYRNNDRDSYRQSNCYDQCSHTNPNMQWNKYSTDGVWGDELYLVTLNRVKCNKWLER